MSRWVADVRRRSRGAPDLAATNSTSTRPTGALRAVLGNPGIRRIELAWACGIAGDAAMLVAMLLVAYEAGGALGVGLLGAARTAPAIITGPLTGLLALAVTRRGCCGSSTGAAPPLRSA